MSTFLTGVIITAAALLMGVILVYFLVVQYVILKDVISWWHKLEQKWLVLFLFLLYFPVSYWVGVLFLRLQ